AARSRLGPDDRLDWTPPAEPLPAPADPALVRSALENLIDNAIKYSQAPRAIAVTLVARDGAAEVGVHDAGIGFEERSARRVFEPFQRGGDEETRQRKGTGLGLFIVRGIAETHGGRAFIGPRAGGAAGTTAGFTISLRRKDA
ncbi:MAG TPA: sensor histidine kinase, partial [Planctomycetota bacterium]|nr:sensor histidine kinase [Planctomycetota bacterium]